MASRENFDISGEGKLPDKISAIKNLAKSYNMRTRGFGWNTSNDSWIITGKALAGSDFINETTGIITSFAEPANLMTTKEPQKFLMEFADAFFRVNTMAVNDISIPQVTYRALIKMFKDTMSNIGDIITGSREVYKEIYKNPDYMNDGGSFE